MLITTNKYESIPNILLKYEANDDEANDSGANGDDDNYILVSGSLKPQSLNITKFKLSNCKTKINSALSKAVKSNKISENIKRLCMLLRDAVANEQPSDSDKVDIIDKLLDGDSHRFAATIKIGQDEINQNKKTFDKLGKNTNAAKAVSLLNISYIRNEIVKDFGEILGSIFLLNHIKDANSVEYSENKAEKVKDYSLKLSDNSYWTVSAKALRRANAPSVSGLIDAINTGGKDTLNKLLVGEDSTVGELKWLVSMLQNSMLQKKSNTVDEWVSIIKKYSAYEENLKNAFEAFSNFFELKDSQDYRVDKFSTNFDEKCRNDLEGVKGVISAVWKALGVSDKASVNSKGNLEYYISLKPKTKVGMFMYPIIKRAVTVMNERLGILGDSEKTDIDVFTKVARYYFSGYKQLYLDVNLLKSGSVSFTFKMVEMGECNWTLLYDKSTMNDPYTRLQMKVVSNFE